MLHGPLFRVSMSDLLEYMDGHRGFFNAQVAASILGEPYARTLHLAFSGLTPELCHHLVDLGKA